MTITPISTPPPCGWSSSFPPHEVSTWRRIRRFAVPRWMIEQATERRQAGDWRGACAAANIDVALDLADVAKKHGKKIAAALEDDLHHFAPDLLLWHLPRVGDGRTTITPDQAVILGRYDCAPRLRITTPGWIVEGPQRLTLRFSKVFEEKRHFSSENVNWTTARHLWDVRHAAKLRERIGGGKDRAPFFNSDGTPRGAHELPSTDPGLTDPAGHTEWVTTLHDKGEIEAAFAAASIKLSVSSLPDWYTGDPLILLRALPLTLFEPELQRLISGVSNGRFQIPLRSMRLLLEGNRGLRARIVDRNEAKNAAVLAKICWRRLPDLDLLRFGHISPEHLHPLVRDAMFPDRPVGDGPVGPPDVEIPSPVRVRCRGEWHEMHFRDGDLQVPHSDAEQRREGAMRAFGGAAAGCFAAQQAWRSGIGWLPRALRDQRKELFARVQHGDTPGVIRLLDAGVDPHARDGRQRTLLHLLHLVDHEPLLPRLLAAGLDIEATDQDGRTPLNVIVGEGGSAELVRALLTAGARIDIADNDTGLFTLHYLIGRGKRHDLHFLEERLEREHADLCTYWLQMKKFGKGWK